MFEYLNKSMSTEVVLTLGNTVASVPDRARTVIVTRLVLGLAHVFIEHLIRRYVISARGDHS